MRHIGHQLAQRSSTTSRVLPSPSFGGGPLSQPAASMAGAAAPTESRRSLGSSGLIDAVLGGTNSAAVHTALLLGGPQPMSNKPATAADAEHSINFMLAALFRGMKPTHQSYG